MSYADEGKHGCLYFGCSEPTADNYDSMRQYRVAEPRRGMCCIWYGCTDGTVDGWFTPCLQL